MTFSSSATGCRLTCGRPVEWLHGVLEERNVKPALIVIDPLARFMTIKDGGNDYMSATQAFEPLIAYARESTNQAHVMLVHHSRKAAGEHGDEALGSTGIFGSVDTALFLRLEGAGLRNIVSINRYGEDLPASMVTLDPESGRVEVSGSKADSDAHQVQDEVIEYILSQKEDTAVPLADIRKGVKRGNRAIGAALAVLVKEEQVLVEGTGRKSDPRRYSAP